MKEEKLKSEYKKAKQNKKQQNKTKTTYYPNTKNNDSDPETKIIT